MVHSEIIGAAFNAELKKKFEGHNPSICRDYGLLFCLFSAPKSVFRAVRGRTHRHNDCKGVSLVVGHEPSAVFFGGVSENPQPVTVLTRAALFLVLIVRSDIVFADDVEHPVALVCKALYLYIPFSVACLCCIYRVVENVDIGLANIYFFYAHSLRNAQIKVESYPAFSAFGGLVRGYCIYKRVLTEALYFNIRNLCFELSEHLLCGLLIAARTVLHYLVGGLHHVSEVVAYLSRFNAVLLDILVVFEVDAVLIFLHLQRLAQLFVLRRAVHDIKKV